MGNVTNGHYIHQNILARTDMISIQKIYGMNIP